MLPELYPQEVCDKDGFLKKDLQPGAMFEIDAKQKMSLLCTLKTQKWEKSPNQDGAIERVEGTGCRIRFRGGKYLCENKTVLQWIMESPEFQNGRIRISPSDETGFWRQVGAVEAKTVEIYEPDHVVHPSFDAIKAKLKDVKPAPAQPLARVG